MCDILVNACLDRPRFGSDNRHGNNEENKENAKERDGSNFLLVFINFVFLYY